METTLGYHVDLPAEQCPKLRFEMHLVEEVHILPKSDEQVDIAAEARLSPAHRAEDSNVAGPAAPSDT